MSDRLWNILKICYEKYLFDYEQFELSKTNTELTKSFDWQDEADKL